MVSATRAAFVALLLGATHATTTYASGITVDVELSPSLSPKIKSVLGRLVLYAAPTESPEPRTRCSDDQDTAQAFGVDVQGAKPGDIITVDESVFGYPRPSLADLKGRELYFQAEIRPYRYYNRSDVAEPLLLPTTCVNPSGQNGAYPSPVGTVYSATVRGTLASGLNGPSLRLTIDKIVEPAPSAGCSGTGADTDYIKTFNMVSPILSKFWGREVKLQACVLLPFGFNEHPEARYPLVIAHGHYSPTWFAGGSFRESPPSPNATGYARVDEEYGYYLYRNWTEPKGLFNGARMLVITINHPVPFFDDSYAVDSANVGPYGTAIIRELIPAVEKEYRGIGQGWARGVFGGSTGGWESLATQVFYPEEFNSAFAACPDPVAFTSYTTVNIYDESNAYYYDAAFKRTARPGVRDSYSGQTVIPGTSTVTYGHPYGQTSATVEEMNHRELVLGPKSRSCGQWDIWEAVFSQKADDGYPARIWDKKSGEINKTVAAYWRENFDLTHIMKRDWKTLGPKLEGKLHVFVGGSDTYFLTDAVMDLQDFLESTKKPYYNGSVTIGVHDGRGFEHCFNGYSPDGSAPPNGISRNIYLQKFVPVMAKRFSATAPEGANMEWHRY